MTMCNKIKNIPKRIFYARFCANIEDKEKTSTHRTDSKSCLAQ